MPGSETLAPVVPDEDFMTHPIWTPADLAAADQHLAEMGARCQRQAALVRHLRESGGDPRVEEATLDLWSRTLTHMHEHFGRLRTELKSSA